MSITTGRLIWITGLAGSGKSTIAKSLTTALKDQGEFVVYLDGDLLREAFGNEYGYDRATRQMLSFKYARLSKMLADQGATVVGAFIAMFHEVHWNRDNIENYYEIFVEVPMEELFRRDQKQLYSSSQDGNQSDVVGLDQAAEFPLNPTLTVYNYGAQDCEQFVRQILDLMS